MRYSEGVKRYNEETKKRIFDEIIAAAEKNNTADISHRDNVNAVIKETEKEDKNMERGNGQARIKSSKGGLIAAACAVLVVGGGIFAVNNKSGKNDFVPKAASTSLTTDAEDSTAEESKAEDSSKAEKEPEEKFKEENVQDERRNDEEIWRIDATKDAVRLVEASDFIGDLQIVNIMKEEIDGKNYVAYYCSITDDNNNGSVIFKYNGEEALTRLCILQADPGSDDILPKVGEKVLVMAKNGVKSTSGGYSLELTDNGTMFRWDNSVNRYVNVFKPGHIIGEGEEGIFGDYENGLYEHEADDYYRSMLITMTGTDNYAAIENWCAYNGVQCRKIIVSGQNFKKGELIGYCWFSQADDGVDYNGITLEISDGESYDPSEEDSVSDNVTEDKSENNNDNNTETNNDNNTDNNTENKTETKDDNKEDNKTDNKTDNNTDSRFVELNVHDSGTTTKEFGDYNIELGRLRYDSEECIYYVIFNVTKKDGSAFTQAELDEAPIDLVYGDLMPYIYKINSSELELYGAEISDSDPAVAEIKLSAQTKGEPYVESGATLEVNTIRVGDKEISGLFNVTFDIDIYDVK